MYDWSKHKIGIVLSGGGAKGAYEIGCWEALAKAGLTFNAIAGTSIGGINGYLMSVASVEEAKSVWIQMGRSSPLSISIFRLSVFFLERLGLLCAMILIVFVLIPAAGLLGLMVTSALVTAVKSFEFLNPAGALVPSLAPVIVLALANALRKTRIAEFSFAGLHYVPRDVRRRVRHIFPVEFAVIFGLALALAPLVMLAVSIIGSGRSWWWSLALPPCFALNLVGILLSSDAGFSSPGEISLFNTERLESLLVKHGTKEDRMPSHPRVYLARLREEVVSVPAMVPRWVFKATRFLPNKSWEELTAEDFDQYREALSRLGLSHYLLNSNQTVIGLEYVEVSGRPVVEAADIVLSTSAIADALGRVQQRLSGVEEENFVVRSTSATFYDPGLVDNTPIAPLLDAGDCDLIVVIFLDYAIKDANDYFEKHLSGLNARLRSLNPDLSDHALEALNEVPYLRPIGDTTSRLKRVKLLPVIPSQPLGRGPIGFIKETLWFRESRIRQLMKLGFRDTERALQKFVEAESLASN
jgi:predicted acylesterase/phospholipase RssA